ncbi:hypothetical protein QNI19_32150 [Cytophagaceae bacterium DM2B3-1]|uniref:Uncharacterized protein n=1 Tax=Xanthocytophaga flava TaxID=3048013 RepID=A0ABT7CVE7_9BACT|nr:hypothetical protein [Xanthocytophaga flavus]MDJ1497636.1 hypothetical protein [Xanthocytophaga flavus]
MINSIQELKSVLKSKALTVKWTVRCDIGPDWIGGGRNVKLYLDNELLDDSEFHNMLIQSLITTLNIPLSTVDDVIDGNGDIKIINSNLVVRYSTQSYTPYDWPKQDKGEIILLSV